MTDSVRRNVALMAALAFGLWGLLQATPVIAHHRDGDQTARIAALEASVADLQARVAALEGGAPSPSSSPTPSPSVAPTPTATSSPPTPSPVLSTPTPAPTPIATASAVFGSRPSSGSLSFNGNCPAVIENRTFRDLGADVIAIRIENCANVTIRAVDFVNVAEGVYAVNSTGITVTDARYQNITGPHQRVGKNRANFVQFNNVRGGLIARNKGRCGDTEDIVSLYRTSNVVVEDNHFAGGDGSPGCLAWSSTSGSGIAVGDDGGSGNIARRNILVNPGQVGMFIAGGTNHTMADNIVIGDQRPGSNVGVYVWNQYAAPCSGHTVSGNRVRWLRADGVVNGYWNAGNCGTVAGSGNNWNDTTLRSSDYAVSL